MLATRYVLGFVFLNSHEVVLLLKNRPKWQVGLHNGVGGHIERDETPLNAMQREWKEEVRCPHYVEWEQYALLARYDGTSPFVINVFRGFIPAGGVQYGDITSREDQLVVIADPHALPDNCISNLSWLIPMALDTNREPHEGLKYEVQAQIGLSQWWREA